MKTSSPRQVVAAIQAFALTAPLAVMAQTTVFNDTFTTGNDTVQSASPQDPTASSTSFEYFQQGAAPGTPVITTGSPGNLKLAGRTTSSSISEVQALFTTTPVTLTTVGDWIDLTVVFTDTQNIFPSASPSTLNIGLFNSGGSKPTTGVRLDASGSSTGGAIGWNGYVGRIGGTGGAASSIYTRATQGPGKTNPNQSQDVLFNGASGSSTYNNPAGVALTTGTPAQLDAGLTAASTYTLDYQISLSAAGTLAISEGLYSGSSVNSANILFSESGLAGTTNYLTGSFDAFALGWRFNSTSAANSINIGSINVNDAIQSVPEPASVCLLGGGALLAVLLRRRQSR
jgi:hypothetical protein